MLVLNYQKCPSSIRAPCQTYLGREAAERYAAGVGA